ncbi:MAG: alpha/beta hydrolase-fold protein [Pseudomonadota bacterium]
MRSSSPETNNAPHSASRSGLLVAMVLLLIASPVWAQKLEPKVRSIEPDHVIHSEITGREYQLYIAFPSGYSTSDDTTYPVLYILDGAYFYPTINQVNRRLSARRQIQDVVIVGIHSGGDRVSWFANRTIDYTPSSDVQDDRSAEREFGIPEGRLESGGAARFLKSIKTEIGPFIEEHYKVNQDRGIAGHSLGGLFAAYCLVNSDGYFTRFGLNSPSMWWHNKRFLDASVQQFENNKTWDIPNSRVFISVGELEDAKQVPTMLSFSQHLHGASYSNVELTWQVFEHETHLTVMPASMSRTLTWLYSKE